ncbi:MAG: hypothetical protein M1482_13595, partial [Chloroflexi bacterium]|nr:hypothetical protein [Chloroflexota bacterium]
MSQAVRLSETLVQQILEQYGDHAGALADLAARVEPAAGELFAAWLAANRTTFADARVAPETVPADQQVQAMQSWFAALRERQVERFFTEVAAWPRQLAALGISYDRTLALFREYQRVTIPLLIRVFPAGPELQAALGAFDDLFDGCRM